MGRAGCQAAGGPRWSGLDCVVWSGVEWNGMVWCGVCGAVVVDVICRLHCRPSTETCASPRGLESAAVLLTAAAA